MTDRVGYWVDMSRPYWTMAPAYVDSVWWALERINDAGLLVQDHRVAPYCPRCGTGLSDHEVAQGYETVTDPSVYVRLPVVGEIVGLTGVDLLVWTTTPWTLVSNTAVAVHPDVITADYVTTEDGTGLVHQAPAFGADDLAAIRRHNLPVVNPIGPDGHFLPEGPLVGGVFFKDADPALIADLEQRELLFASASYEHQYPHCWRCHTPLMYYAQLSWYIRTTARRAELRRENERTTWYPEHIKHGRFGDWLANNVDWALSRNRYWGTPLPVWRCPQEHLTCVGSRAELGELAGRDLSGLDPHRPYIDEVTFACPACGEDAARVPEVIDAWFDSGSMPFASLGYPYAEGSVEQFDKYYPAQFICEAIDQTRGWFYTMLAVGTLVFDRSSYENVVCLGHIMAEDGRKMSKHLGNIIEPIPFMDKHGADALRWFMLCSGSPWSPRRVGDSAVEEIVRKVLLTYWNTASFFTLYASTSGWTPSASMPVAQRPVLDRWALAELDHVVSATDAALEDFDTAGAGRVLAQFIDDLSNWYVRRCRARFWASDADALATLHECLHTVTRLLAPFIPFLTEHVWQHAIVPGDAMAEDSVHLARWPAPDGARADGQLRTDMDITRALVEAGRSARKAANVRVRQPLQCALLGIPGSRELPAEFVSEIADELNVREVTALAAAGEVVDVTVKPNFRALGKRFGSRTQQAAKAIRDADPGELARVLRAERRVLIDVDGEPAAITPDEVTLSEVPRSGWVINTHQGMAVALDTTITPDLRKAGLAREVIRLVQAARKDAGFEVTDRIVLSWAANGETADALREHERELADAVLAVEINEYFDTDLPADTATAHAGAGGDTDLGVRFRLVRAGDRRP